MALMSCFCGLCAEDKELQQTHTRWRALFALLNEHQARLFAADKALEVGTNGASVVSRILGLSPRTIERGIREFKQGVVPSNPDHVRQAGGGRKPSEEVDSQLVQALEELMAENTAGDPMALLKWTCKSLRKLAAGLGQQGHAVSHSTVGRLLRSLHYSLRGNVKALEGKQHPQRDAQFRYIHQQAQQFVQAQLPVISVDTKKKEKVGKFEQAGQAWRREDRLVNTHDFPSQAQGTAIPYGIYDEKSNEGFVNVGMSHDTAAFAVASIERWWEWVGQAQYPRAKKLLITADNGGSNGSRIRLWKASLQGFADRSGLEVTVCHYPTGTSKWNRIEHRLFSFISMNWRGEPLTSYEVVVELISHTTTKKGLHVQAKLDEGTYPQGVKIADEEMQELDLLRHAFMPDWNYTIRCRE